MGALVGTLRCVSLFPSVSSVCACAVLKGGETQLRRGRACARRADALRRCARAAERDAAAGTAARGRTVGGGGGGAEGAAEGAVGVSRRENIGRARALWSGEGPNEWAGGVVCRDIVGCCGGGRS